MHQQDDGCHDSVVRAYPRTVHPVAGVQRLRAVNGYAD